MRIQNNALNAYSKRYIKCAFKARLSMRMQKDAFNAHSMRGFKCAFKKSPSVRSIHYAFNAHCFKPLILSLRISKQFSSAQFSINLYQTKHLWINYLGNNLLTVAYSEKFHLGREAKKSKSVYGKLVAVLWLKYFYNIINISCSIAKPVNIRNFCSDALKTAPRLQVISNSLKITTILKFWTRLPDSKK